MKRESVVMALNDDPVGLVAEHSGRSQMMVAYDSFVTLGGVLLVIGSITPWNQVQGVTTPVTFYVNGLQLGSSRSFSIAGLVPLVCGTCAMLIGAIRLAEKHVPKFLDPLPIVSGVAGVAVGLYGLGWASWSKGQVTTPVGRFAAFAEPLFKSTAGVGVWLVLIGGLLVLVSEVFSLPVGGTVLQRAIVTSAVLLLASTGAVLLAPEVVGWSL